MSLVFFVSQYERLFEEKNFLISIVKILLPLTSVFGLIVFLTLSYLLDYHIIFYVSLSLVIFFILIFGFYLLYKLIELVLWYLESIEACCKKMKMKEDDDENEFV